MKKQRIEQGSHTTRATRALLLALAIAALGSGCGQQAYNEGNGTTLGGTGGTTGTGTSTGGDGNIPPWTPPTVTTPSNASPSYSFHFQEMGQNKATQLDGTAMTVSTDTILKISVRAGDGMPLSTVNGKNGFTVGFNCEMFDIKVGNITKTAFVKKAQYTDFMLYYGYMQYDPCQSAPTTWTGDFSAGLSPGHGALTISVTHAQYDNCRLNGDVYDGGCGMSLVYEQDVTSNPSKHVVDAYMDVYTTN